MLTTGLGELITRSIMNQEARNSVQYSSMLYMFNGTPPEFLSESNLVGTGNDLSGSITDLLHSAEGICFPNFVLDKADNKISVSMLNGDPAGIREKIGSRKSSYIPDSTKQVYDINIAASRDLGDCIMYHPNNIWSAWQAGTGLPAGVIPPVLPVSNAAQTVGLFTGSNAFAGKKLRTYAQLNDWSVYLGRRGSFALAGATDNHRAHVIMVFDEPVWADFLYLNVLCHNNVATRTFSHVSLILPDDSFIELPTFSINQLTNYVLGFTKTLIKGLRLATTHQTLGTVQAFFYLNQFTAGLKNGPSDPEFSDNTRDPFTWGLLVPSVGATTAALTQRQLPIALVSIGDPASGADIEMNGRSEHYIRPDCIVQRKLIELDL